MEVLTNPRGFYADLEEGQWRYPTVIVTIAGVTSVTGVLAVMGAVTEILPAGVQSLVLVSSAVFTISVLFATYISWLAVSAIVFGLSSRLGGNGEFATLMRYMGWGFVPSIFDGLFNTALSARVAMLLLARPPAETQDAIATASQSELFTIALVFSVLFQLWSGLIWTFAVAEGRNHSLSTATVIAAVPMSLLITITVFFGSA